MTDRPHPDQSLLSLDLIPQKTGNGVTLKLKTTNTHFKQLSVTHDMMKTERSEIQKKVESKELGEFIQKYVLGCHMSVYRISYSSNQSGSQEHISLRTIMFCF